MIRSAYLIILAIFTVFSGCKKHVPQQIQSTTISNILQSIPEKERKTLDSFVQLLFREYNFAYTLFGKKPMSIACYSSQINLWTLHNPNEFLIFEKGWALWKKYSSSFSSEGFVLKQCKDSTGVFEILLINKKYALQAISNNIEIFQEILGDHLEPQQILHQICYSEQDIMETLKDHSGLLGILLGYGKINSMLFERKVNICKDLNAKMTPPFSAHQAIKSLHPISQHLVNLYKNRVFSPVLTACSPSSEYSSLADELNDILQHEEVFELYGSDFFLDKIISPVFMMRKGDRETKELYDKYLVTKQKLRYAYQHGAFLEVTLNQWIYPQ